MTAIHHSADNVENGLRPTNFARDLRAIAELVEVCFADQLDGSGQAAIREMKVAGSMGPLLWLFGALDPAMMGMGYVWLVDRRVVGNVSLYRAHATHNNLSSGRIIANVAVHPDHRRQGIARTLMEATLNSIAHRGVPWALLQVEDDNVAAIKLYESLGFSGIGRVSQWEGEHNLPSDHTLSAAELLPRLRRADEWRDEMELARRDRSDGLSWARVLDPADFQQKFTVKVADLLAGKRRRRWSLDDGVRLIGSLWVASTVSSGVRMTLLLDPEVNQMEIGMALLTHGLSTVRAGKRVRLESSERDPDLHDALRQMGFKPMRKLIQMRWKPEST